MLVLRRARSVHTNVVVAVCLLFANTTATQAAGFPIVDDDGVHAVIVTSDTPTPVVRYAATELQRHLELATGCRLEITSEAQAASPTLPFRIYLGPCSASRDRGIAVDELPPNGFRNKTTEKAIFLIGKDDHGKPNESKTRHHLATWKDFAVGEPPLDDAVSMGSLLAVYDWLERQVKARWLWPGELGTVVPKTKVISAGATGEQTVVPSLIHSQARLRMDTDTNSERARHYVYETNVWLRRQRFTRGVSFQYGHAYTNYWKRFGVSHPEYFAMRPDGIRAPATHRTQLVQMCVSNPGLHQHIVADWQKRRTTPTGMPWINGQENDKGKVNPSCTCEKCRDWDPPNSPLLLDQQARKDKIHDTSDMPLVSLSDRYAKFWLALQKEGEKYDPNATVIGYAYADYRQPPVETKLNKRIIVAMHERIGCIPRPSRKPDRQNARPHIPSSEGGR